MTPDAEPLSAPPGGAWSALVTAAKGFEDAWRRGPRPALDDFVPSDGPLRRRLLVELAHIELELRLKAGEPARAEEYLGRFPELARDRAAAVELIAAELELRQRAEPGLTADEYLRRFPEYDTELRAEIARATTHPPGDTVRRGDALRDAPTQVAGFEILGVLGRGGMGFVYKARQLDLDRLVALKFLPRDCARDPDWLDRFRREAVTASALNHPHISTIYGTGECDGRPFFSMELVEGQTLRALVGRPVVPQEMARLFGQAAQALAAAHAAGVVHRDVKPENVMVRADGIVKVLDFGLARRLSFPAAGGTGTDPGMRVGTVLYMSPEQARAEPVGTASDIFSLGVVLYELATGRHPFRADSEIEVLHAIAAQAPVPPRRLNPALAAGFGGLIERMLAKDPRARPTATDVVTALAELADERGRPAAPPTAFAERPPFVGRSGEAGALAEAFAAAEAGRGQWVCVTGQPGLGKTTLVEHFFRELAAGRRPCVVGRGRCSERLAGSEAYLPILEALDSLAHGDDGPELAPLMGVVAPTWFGQLATHAEGPPRDAAADTAKASSQERLKRELVALVQELSRVRPLVVFLDDVHWADTATADVLAYLGPRCAATRLLVVVTYRPTELLLSKHPFLAVQLELQHAGLCREVPLRFLGRGDVENYLTLAFPGHSFPEEFAELLHARTEGNPLFLVDLLRYLRDCRVVVPTPGGWELTQAVPDFQDGLPQSIRGMLRKKLALLDKADLRLLSVASVQGYEFDAAVAAEVLRREPAEVEERLADLDRVHGLVRVRDEHEFPDGTVTVRYRFVHVLYQNTLYTAIQPSRRAAWSAAVARALVARHAGQSAAVAAELALLFEAAREFPRAIDYFLLASGNAVRVFAHREAAALARRGLALLPKLPAGAARDGRELALLLALGVSLVASQGFAAPEVEQTYARARELCEQAEDVPGRFPVLYGLWNVYLVRCELPRCVKLADQMYALAATRDDPILSLVAHNVRQQPLFHRGELTAARRHQEQGLALYEAPAHRGLTAVYGEDPGVGCLGYGAATLWHLGYPDQAVVSARAARRLAEEIGSPFNRAQALYFSTYVRVCRREPGQVRELAAALIELAREQDFALLFAGGVIFEGWSMTQFGPPDEGIARMREGLAAWHATGALSHRVFHLALLARAMLQARRLEEGWTVLDEAQALCLATEEHFAEPELHRLKGELLRTQSSHRPSAAREAETCFEKAAAAARGQQAKSLELRAVLSRSRLLRDCTRAEDAWHALREVCDWFTEGRETPDLQDARAFLDGVE